jgi:hypothetical protein
MVLGIAWLLLIIAIPLQVFGYATTCTQLADGSFITGAILSALPLGLSISLVLFKAFTAPNRATGVLFMLVTLGMMFTTSSIWANTIFIGTPCGPDFAEDLELYGPNELGNAIIIAGYFLLPAVMLVAAALLAFRQKKPSSCGGDAKAL